MQRELHSLIQREMWKEGYIPAGVKAIATKWVYNLQPSLLFKSRLVARGDQRPHNSSEPDSYSPTLSRISLNYNLLYSTRRFYAYLSVSRSK